MKARKLVYVFSVLIGAATLYFFGPSSAMAADKAKTLNWRMCSQFSPGDLSADTMRDFGKRVNENSKGRLMIRTFYADEVIPGVEVLDAVSKGMIEMASLSTGTFQGKYPALVAHASTPFGLKGSFEEAFDFATKGEIGKIVEDTLSSIGVHVLGYVPYGSHPALVSRVPIRSVNDFKGIKIRTNGPITVLMNALGAAAGFLPGGEVYLALQLGTYDAATYSIDCVDGLKWREVMKYFIQPYFTTDIFGSSVVNKAAWEKLPEDLKEVVREAAQWYFNKNHTESRRVMKMVIDRSKEWGYEVITLPPADVEKIEKVAIEKVWPSIAKDPASTRVLELLKKWHGVQ
jgi:TRAP-type mannitol/chloroaromatic compound transport system substrate-binding protein